MSWNDPIRTCSPLCTLTTVQQKFIFASYFLWPVSLKNLRNLLRRSQKNLFLRPTQRATHRQFNIRGIGDLIFCCAVSALLAQASLSPSSWYRQCRQPDWTPSWRSARACAPGYCSLSLQTHEPNSAASCTAGSLGVQYPCQWSACSNRPWFTTDLLSVGVFIVCVRLASG